MRLYDSAKQDEYADFVYEIKKECKQYLRDTITGKDSISLILSGRGKNTPYFKGKVRKGREPMDMHPEIHKDFDDEFKKKFGIRGRSECLFASGNSETASQYGVSYIIFPKGRYKILWSPKIKDLFSYIQKEYNYDSESDIINALKKWFTLKLYKKTIDNEVEKVYKKYIEDTVITYKVSPTSTPTVKAIDSYNELMISCDEYYAIRYIDWSRVTFAYKEKYGDFFKDL